MGNQLASTKPVASPSDYALHELPNNVVYKDTLGSGRFLKTLQCFHDEGLVVVKVYFKRGELFNVKEHEERLLEIRQQLSGFEQSHVWPFQRWLETDKAAYLLRQYFFSNLHDRLSTRPFLSLMEKKWLAFQLLKAVEQSHDRNVCHGDIKCENVLVTSWNWLYLTDYASFKPTYLPADNPADFSFFFDTGGRRRCYLAPERFYDPGDPNSTAVNAALSPAMDVFSMGCVIAELFLEGQALFDLSALLAYRNGKHELQPLLAKIPDVGIRDMVAHMVQLSPALRLSARGYLQTWAPQVFPSYFSPFLHDFFSGMTTMDVDARVARTLEAFGEIHEHMLADALQVNKSHLRNLEMLHIQDSAPNSSQSVEMGAGVDYITASKERAFAHNHVKGQMRGLETDGQNDLITDLKKLLGDTERLRAGASIMAGPFSTVDDSIGSARKGKGQDRESSSNSTRSRKQLVNSGGFLSGPALVESRNEPPSHGFQKTIALQDAWHPELGGDGGRDGILAQEDRLREFSKLDFATRPKNLAIAFVEATSDVEELVMEEVYEYEVREIGASSNPQSPHASNSVGMWNSWGLSRRKEDTSLPSEGGWRWDGEWELDLSGGSGGLGADKEGWRYRTSSAREEPSESSGMEGVRPGRTDDSKSRNGPLRDRRLAGQTSVSGYGWSNVCTPTSMWRQRRWIRRRRRKPPSPSIVSGAGESKFPSVTWPRRGQRLPTGRTVGKLGEEELGHQVRCEGMVLIAGLLCGCLRNLKLPQYRRACVELLRDAAAHCDDDTRLQRVVPFVVSLLSDNRDASNLDSPAVVKYAALYALADVLDMVRSFPATDAKIFPEYLFPSLSLLPQHNEETVRAAYADNISKFAESAHRFLICSSHVSGFVHSEEAGSKLLTEAGLLSSPKMTGGNGVVGGEVSVLQRQQLQSHYDVELNNLRDAVKGVVEELVTGPRSTSAVRKALLLHMASLCRFFGRKYSNDFLLPLLITFLNDRDDQVRAAFFEHVAQVCVFVGRTSLEAFLLPCIEQALNDMEEAVIVSALGCLTSLCVKEQLRKRVLLGAAERTAPLLCHPSAWVRRAAVAFIAASGAQLAPADAHALLAPLLAPLVRREPTSLSSEAAILTCLKPPVSRRFFNLELSNALQSISSTANVGGSKPSDKLPSNFRQVRLNGLSASDLVASPFSAGRDHNGVSKQSLLSPSKRGMLDGGAGPTSPSGDSGETEDGEKVRALQGYIRNSSSVIHSKIKQWEAEGTDKFRPPVPSLRATSVAGPAQNLGNFDGGQDLPSVGIPVYSLLLPERKPEPTSADGDAGQGAEPSDSFVSSEWNRAVGVRRAALGMGSAFAGEPRGPVINLVAPPTGHSFLPAASQHMQRSIALAGPPLVHNSIATSRYSGVWEDVTRTLGPVAALSGSVTAGGIGGAVPARMKPAGNSQVGIGTSSPVGENASSDGLMRDPVTKLVGISFTMGSSTDHTWRPKGVLLAHLHEHQKAVNQVAVSPSNSFFASASDDGTVRIWDCRRLERDLLFKSRLTYGGLQGRALCVTMLDGNLVAASSSTGSVHVFHVDYVARSETSPERYTGVSDVRKVEGNQGPVLSLQSVTGDGPVLVLYSSLKGGLHLCDTRLQKEAWVLKQPSSYGYICSSTLHPGDHWVVSATSRGVLTLWDLRFRLPVNIWQHPSGGKIDALAALLPGVGALSGPASFPPPHARPLVYVAAGREEVGLWNAENGTCHQVLRVASPSAVNERAALSETPAALLPVRSSIVLPTNAKTQGGGKASPAGDVLGMEELNSPAPPLPGFRALLPVVGGATLITAGTDCRIRQWDRLRPDKSHWICGPPVPGEVPKLQYDSRTHSGVRVLQELVGPSNSTSVEGGARLQQNFLSAAANDGAGCHRDTILSLSSVQVSQRLLISSSRDGAVKVWK